jgi:RNA polymerase sigma-70 factor (ECF subfamily)
VARNLVINWLKQRERRVAAAGGSDFQAWLDMSLADSSAETAEFDLELRRSLFQLAAEQVRVDVEPATWQAFWETGVLGTSTADVATKLGMSAGAVRVAKCRVLVRIKEAVSAMEISP